MLRGVPPEPPAEHQGAHKAWEGIQHLKTIKPPLQRHEGVFHAPLIAAPNLRNGETDAINFSSANWSGSAIFGKANQYATGATAMSVLVPMTKAAFGCDKSQDPNDVHYTAIWSGIDGLGSSTVEQAGIQIVSDCADAPAIGPWIEVYPNPEVIVTNFPVSPGDMIDIWAWTNQSLKLTCAAWENESKQNYTTACLNNPVNPIQATSIEWIVERPQIGSAGNLATLGNYVTIPIWSALAWDYQTGATFGAAASPPSAWGSTGTAYSIDMIDNNGATISTPNPRWWDTLFMYDVGPAYCRPGAKCQPRY
jgi:hypothetical protein